jgi:hypothetical protein
MTIPERTCVECDAPFTPTTGSQDLWPNLFPAPQAQEEQRGHPAALHPSARPAADHLPGMRPVHSGTQVRTTAPLVPAVPRHQGR